MKIKCPENDRHNRFFATAHVTEDWLVDEHGQFIEVAESALEVVHQPDRHDIFRCADCGTEGKIED